MEEREKEGHCGPRTRRKERGKDGHAPTKAITPEFTVFGEQQNFSGNWYTVVSYPHQGIVR
jgi:hypothetical protein